MPADNPKLLTVSEMAIRFGVSERTVRGWAERGEIECFKIGSRMWRFPEAKLPQEARGQFPIGEREMPIPLAERVSLRKRAVQERDVASLILQLLAFGYSRKQIAYDARVQTSSISRWLSGRYPISAAVFTRFERLVLHARKVRLSQILKSLPISALELPLDHLSESDRDTLAQTLAAAMTQDTETRAAKKGMVLSIGEPPAVYLVVLAENSGDSLRLVMVEELKRLGKILDAETKDEVAPSKLLDLPHQLSGRTSEDPFRRLG